MYLRLLFDEGDKFFVGFRVIQGKVGKVERRLGRFIIRLHGSRLSDCIEERMSCTKWNLLGVTPHISAIMSAFVMCAWRDRRTRVAISLKIPAGNSHRAVQQDMHPSTI